MKFPGLTLRPTSIMQITNDEGGARMEQIEAQIDGEPPKMVAALRLMTSDQTLSTDVKVGARVYPQQRRGRRASAANAPPPARPPVRPFSLSLSLSVPPLPARALRPTCVRTRALVRKAVWRRASVCMR